MPCGMPKRVCSAWEPDNISYAMSAVMSAREPERLQATPPWASAVLKVGNKGGIAGGFDRTGSRNIFLILSLY